MSKICRVSVVVDREYGERLPDLNRSGPVWIVDTPINRTSAQKIWTAKPNLDQLDGVTTFKIDSNDSPEDNLVGELDAIDLHHGVHSSDPVYTILEIVGTQLTDRVKGELARYGFNKFQPTEQGFGATRPLPKSLQG